MADGRSRSRPVLLVVAIGLAAAAVTAVLLLRAGGATGGYGAPGVMLVGVNHTQETIEPWDDPASRRVAMDILNEVAPVQNQFIMGWGALNPEPRENEYDWASLDRRMRLIQRTADIPVITLCCAPDWMKGGRQGVTDWGDIRVAPDPEHFDDYAELAAEVAKRYRQVRHFIVWSEMRGFYDTTRNQWNARLYADLYNKVYRALKDVDPDIQVGGPSMVIDAWKDAQSQPNPSALRGAWGVIDQRILDSISYWLDNADGYDFVVVDGSTANRWSGLAVPTEQAVEKFRLVNQWLRERTSAPIWWSEVYAPAELNTRSPYSTEVPATPQTLGLALRTLRDSGTAVALLWNPQGDGDVCVNCLWTDPADGAQATPFVDVLRGLRE